MRQILNPIFNSLQLAKYGFWIGPKRYNDGCRLMTIIILNYLPRLGFAHGSLLVSAARTLRVTESLIEAESACKISDVHKGSKPQACPHNAHFLTLRRRMQRVHSACVNILIFSGVWNFEGKSSAVSEIYYICHAFDRCNIQVFKTDLPP